MKFVKNTKTIFILLLGLIVSTNLFAVDGYKGLKFGITQKQVLAAKLCTFVPVNSGILGVDGLECNDFNLGGQIVKAYAFFINDKFLRLAIYPPIEVLTGLTNSLSTKYGEASSSSTKEEFEAVDNSPNKEAYLAFDKDTIILKIISNENNLQSALLLYNSPEYESSMDKKHEESLKNDL
jgi:hypothetical protein